MHLRAPSTLIGAVALATAVTTTVLASATPLGYSQAGGYAAVVLADAPVAYWRLGESSGTTAVDASGNNLHSTYINGVGLGLTGAVANDPDTAAGLDGINDRIERAPVTTQLANVTLEAWVYWTGCCDSTGGPLIVYNGESGSNGYGLQISSGGGSSCGPANQLFVLLGGVTCDAAGAGGPIPLNQWTHVAASRTSANVWAIYVNGEKRTERSGSSPNAIGSGATTIADHSGGGGGDGSLQGRIDEVALYNTALTPSRIRAHYDAGVGTTGSPPPEQSIGTCDGTGTHANSGSSCQDDPVNSLTGAFTTSVTDLRLPGIGVPFRWSRSYTSADLTVGRLGPGWTDSYGTSLLIQGNGDVILHGDEGQRVYYTKQGSSFVGVSGALSTLTSVAGGYELVRRDQVTYAFDTQGRLTSMKDRNNQGLTLAYDGSGQLQTITDSVGRQVAATFTTGLLSRATLPDGRYVEYSYTAGRLTSVRDTRGGTTLYTYDAGGRLKTIVDQNVHTVVDNTYGPDGRVIEQVNARGKHGFFAWNPTTQTATYTDARQNQWKDVYSGNLLVERIDPLGNSTRFEYDAGLHVNKITDARNNATTMTYDTRGNMLTRTAPAPLSFQEVWTYSARNDPLTYRDGRGNVTDLGYDAAGNLTSVTGPDADGPGPLGRPQTQYGRDSAGTGLLTSLTDPRGKQTTFAYTNGNLTQIQTQLQNRTTMGYDGSGRLTSLVDPRGNASGANPADFTWTYAYNDADGLLTQIDPLGNTTTLDYDLVGNLSAREDAKLHTTSYGYDEQNNLVTVTAPDPDAGGPIAAPVTQYTYDDVGNIGSRKDANLRDTLYTYDNANRLIQVAAPLNRVWTYGYDGNGNVTQVVDANGNATGMAGDGQTTYGYDALNRPTSVDYSDTTPDVTVTYDANSNRTQMTDGSGTETYAYDALDRLTAVTRGANSFAYAYDLVNLTQVTYPGGTVVAYAFDDDERLQSAVSSGQTTSYGYDEAGNLRTTTLPSGNGYVETRSYDRAGRLVDAESKKGASVLSKFAISLDPIGNPLSVVRTGSLAQTQTYGYDGMDRQTSVCFQAGSCPSGSDPFIRWTYDGVGNRLTEARPAGTTSYTLNAADELTQAGSTAYTYDQNGNQLSAGSRTFAYDLGNRVKTTTSGNTTTTYLYDGDGTRLQASTGSQASKKTNFLWDVNRSLPQLALERDGSNNPVRTYRYGARRISQSAGSNTSYFIHDGLGSTSNLTSSSGATQWTWSYEPYGSTRTETKASGNQPDNLMRFTGEYLDPTGIYHLRARQYDSGTGRFLARDPVAAPLSDPSTSAYAYVMNRPTVFVDPSGEFFRLPSPWPGGCSGLCEVAEQAGEVGGAVVEGVVAHPQESLAVAQIGACATGVGCGVVAFANAAYAAYRVRQAFAQGCEGNAAAIAAEAIAARVVTSGGVALIGRTRTFISGPIGKRGRQQVVDLSLSPAQQQTLQRAGDTFEGVIGVGTGVSTNCK